MRGFNPFANEESGYSANISTRMHRDEYVTLESMEKICRVLDCKVDDIVEFIPDEYKVAEK